MTDVTWEQPPPPIQPGQRIHPAVWVQLQDKPGEWANLGAFARGYASTLRGRHPGYEFTARAIPDQPTRTTLYARYIGRTTA